MEDGWERFWDENHQAYYLFNRATGESKWDDTEPARELQSQWEGFDMVASTTEGTSQRKKKTKSKKKPQGMERNNAREEDPNPEVGIEDENIGIALITDADRTFAETEGDILCYTRCMFVTAGLVEGPLVVIEAIVRSVAFLALSLMYTILYIVKKAERDYWHTQIKKAVREAIICVASALTFMLPLAGCFVYRTYRSSEEEWDLAPMPTLVGWVDSRRFFVLCLGGGSNAERGRPAFVQDDEDYIGETSGDIVYEQMWDLHMPKSLDSWEGGIPFAPRKIHRSLSNVMRGEEALLNISDVDSQLVNSVSNL